jgi:pilus assembly protein CpaB
MLMPRRLLAATAAVLLAVLGAVVLVSYAHNADARARAGEQLVPVLVVNIEVKSGTAVSAIAGNVSVAQVPKRLAVSGGVSNLAALGDVIATTALMPGQQVATGYFKKAADLLPVGTVAVPPDKVEVSVSLDVQRAAGGVVKAGDLVGVQITEQPGGATDVAPLSVYGDVLHDVLVTRVVAPSDGTAKADPNASYTVTLAVSQKDAEAVIRGGTASKAVWLSLEKAAVGSSSAGSGSSGSTTTSFTTSSTSGGSK